MMKLEEIKNLSEQELIDKINELKKDLFALNFKRKYGKVEKPHTFKEIRRTIARINTVIKEKRNETKKKDT